jgi:chaperonin cofactor prefoldin
MDIDDLIGALRTQRDDLRVRLHLLKAELRDEFNDLEDKWEHLESRAGHLKDASKESAEDVGAAAGQLAEELGTAYERMKKSLR